MVAAAGFCTALVLVPLAGRLWAARASPLTALAESHASVTLDLTTTGDPRPLAATGVAGAPRVAVPADSAGGPGPGARAGRAVARRAAAAAGPGGRLARAVAGRPAGGRDAVRRAAAGAARPAAVVAARRRGGAGGSAPRGRRASRRGTRAAARAGRRRHRRARPGAHPAVPRRGAHPPGGGERDELLDHGRRAAAGAAPRPGASRLVRARRRGDGGGLRRRRPAVPERAAGGGDGDDRPGLPGDRPAQVGRADPRRDHAGAARLRPAAGHRRRLRDVGARDRGTAVARAGLGGRAPAAPGAGRAGRGARGRHRRPPGHRADHRGAVGLGQPGRGAGQRARRTGGAGGDGARVRRSAPRTRCGRAARQGLAWLAGWPCRWLVGVADRLGALPGARLPWFGGLAGALALLAATIALVVLAARRGLGRWLAAAAVVAVLVQVPVRSVVTAWPPAGWDLVACDVGQGDALVLDAGPHTAVEIDAGPDPVLGRPLPARAGRRRRRRCSPSPTTTSTTSAGWPACCTAGRSGG